VILYRHRFVERTVIRVDALKGETLRRVEAVVIGFLEDAFRGRLSVSCCGG
jgi:hypothetical protein